MHGADTNFRYLGVGEMDKLDEAQACNKATWCGFRFDVVVVAGGCAQGTRGVSFG